jgi:hypothetical protein
MAGTFHVAFCSCWASIETLMINFSIIFGQPFKNPLWMALKRGKTLGLHRDWCANLTAFARVHTEWVNAAKHMPGWASLATNQRCGAGPTQGPGHGQMVGQGVVHTFVWIGRVHRSVLGSLYPVNITLSLYITLHSLLPKTTFHLALHSGQMPINDAVVNDGMICLVKTVGKPRI